jgi:hypothetical protein
VLFLFIFFGRFQNYRSGFPAARVWVAIAPLPRSLLSSLFHSGSNLFCSFERIIVQLLGKRKRALQ